MRYLDKTQLRRLLEVAREDDPKHHLLILVSYWHGLRASEAVALHSRDIEDGYITVKRLKGSMRTRQKLVSSSDPLFDEKTLLGHAGLGPLFDGYTRHDFRNLMVRLCKKAGLSKALAHPHVLKHSICTHSIRSAGIENVRQWVGHRSISSTGEYLKVTDEQAFDAIANALLPGIESCHGNDVDNSKKAA